MLDIGTVPVASKRSYWPPNDEANLTFDLRLNPWNE